MGNNQSPMNFELIFNKSQSPALLLDHSLTIVWCNEAYEEVVGFARETLVGLGVFEAFPVANETQRLPLLHSLQRACDTKQPDLITQLHYDLPDRPAV